MKSHVQLAIESTLDDTVSPPVTSWGWLHATAIDYLDYYPLLFDVDGVIPWSISGTLVGLAPFDTFTGYGTTEWYVHLGGGLPGIFELATFEDGDDPDEPSNVETFEFESRVIGPLPRVVYNSDTDTDPLPTQSWRFWPGKLATLIP